MFERRNNWAIAAGSVSIAFYVSALVANGWKAWLSLSVGLALSAVTIALVIYARPGRPRLFVGEPACFERDLVSAQTQGYVQTLSPDSPGVTGIGAASVSATAATTADGITVITTGGIIRDRLYCLYVHVWNQPARGHDIAKDVFAQITFARNGVDLHVMPARWSHTVQTLAAESLQVPSQIDVPANGSRWRLDVAFKGIANDDECFAVNDQTRFDSPDWRSVPLGRKAVDVRVECFGTGCRSASVFRLTANGPGVEPTLTFVGYEPPAGWLGRFLRWVGADRYTS